MQKSSKKVDHITIKMPEDATIVQVEEMYKKILETIENNGSASHPVVLDISQIQRIDTACLQLLISCVNSASKCKFTIHGESAALNEIGTLYGIDKVLRGAADKKENG